MIVFLDACSIIYWVEMNESQYVKFAKKLHDIHDKYDNVSFAASHLSLLECRIKPLREKNEDVLKRYHHFFSARNLVLVSMSLSVIEEATLLRARHNLQTPDAIQAASALSLSEEVLFLTGDVSFKKVPQLDVVII